MKTLIPGAIRSSLMFTAVAALSLAYPASVQAVPTTYRYTGNPFTSFNGPYTESDFVSGMVTLAGPLAPNFSGTVTPTRFTFTDGVQTISNQDATGFFFLFKTGPAGQITEWIANVRALGGGFLFDLSITTFAVSFPPTTFFGDSGQMSNDLLLEFGGNHDMPGRWVNVTAVADTGSTLSLMTLTLMALGLVARRFKRAAG